MSLVLLISQVSTASPVSTVSSLSPLSQQYQLSHSVTSANYHQCIIYITSVDVSSVSTVSQMSPHRPTLSVMTRDMTVSCRHGSDPRLSTVTWFVWTNCQPSHALSVGTYPLSANTVQCQCCESCIAQSKVQRNISCQHVTLACVLVK